jgi:hypothetical protein
MTELSQVVDELEKAVGESVKVPTTGNLVTVAETKAQVLSAFATYKMQEKSAQMLEAYFQANAKTQAETLQELKEQVDQMKGQSSLMSEQVNTMRDQSTQMSAQARNTRLLTYAVLAAALASLGLALASFLHI